MKCYFLTSILLFSVCNLKAAIKLPSIFSDRMVLLQKTEAAIWGKASPGATVTIRPEWSKAVFTTIAAPDGKWSTMITTPTAGGPYNLKISDGSEVTISDVLIGEVWLCTGQSNMGVHVQVTDDAENELKNIPSPKLRIFQPKAMLSLVPVEDLAGEWVEVDEKNMKLMHAIPYFFGRDLQKLKNIPVGIIACPMGASSNEAWLEERRIEDIPSVKKLLEERRSQSQPLTDQLLRKTPTSLYYGTLQPLIPFSIRGMLWYQGEGNRFDVPVYRIVLGRFLESVREDWNNPEMPFILAQLSGHGVNGKLGEGWVNVQLEQFDLSKRYKNVATVMTYDVGDEKNIHPKNKRVVADRFLLAVRKLVYGENLLAQGPVIRKWEVRKDKVTIVFDNVGKGLSKVGSDAQINNFEVAGENKEFKPAAAKIIGKNKVQVSAASVHSPVHVRYAAKPFNPEVNLYNSALLPAVPFKSDYFFK